MKKIIFLSVILISQGIHGMYLDGPKLEHDQVKLTNKASIPLEIVWFEYAEPLRNGKKITRTIKPGETITVKIGEVGGYSRNTPTKVSYNPIPGNEAFKQEFTIDLPSASAWAFTAVKLAEILNNIWVPGVLKADEKGNFGSFQYMNMEHPSQWERAMLEAGKMKPIQK